MTEVTLKLGDPQATLHVLGEAAIEFDNEGAGESLAILNEVRDQIRAQLPKPKPEEPTDWGSVIRARLDDPGFRYWVRVYGSHLGSPAHSAFRAWQHGTLCVAYDDLDDVEVVRVGVGPTPEQVEKLIEEYKKLPPDLGADGCAIAEWEREVLNKERLKEFADRLLGRGGA